MNVTHQDERMANFLQFYCSPQIEIGSITNKSINIAGQDTSNYMTAIPLSGKETINANSADFTQNANLIVRGSL